MRLIIIFILLFTPYMAFSGEYQISNIYGDYVISKVGKKISMDLEGVSLIDVLKALSQQTGLNFVSTEAVKERKLTLYFENVPLRNAIDIIFKANGLSYDYFPDAKIFIVKEMGKPTIELKTKVYYLKYIRLSSSRLQNEIDDILGGEEKGISGEDKKNGEGEEEKETEIGASKISEAVNKVLTENGKVVEDPLTNSLIVVDVPSQFLMIDEIIRRLDIPQPKIMIEVEMLDVSKHVVDELGFDFGDSPFTLVLPGDFSAARFFIGDLTKKGKAIDDSGVAGSLILGNTYASVLDYIRTHTDTKYLARPRILTLSGETAEIKIETDELIGLTPQYDEGLLTGYETERAPTGVALRVTPHVNLENQEITMVVWPKVVKASLSSIQPTTFLAGQTKYRDPEERGTKSVVRLKNGETLFIGGLIKNDRKDTIKKVPFLGDIPFLGALFRHKSYDNDERELLVFLTPHIAEDVRGFTSLSKLQEFREQSTSSRKKAIDRALEKFSKK